MNLAVQRKKFDIVVGAAFVTDFFVKIQDIVKSGFSYYAILHDLDTDSAGVFIHTHYHLILTNEKKVRASQVLTLLSKILECDPVNIQIQQCINFTSSLKYLIHLNATDKFQYDRQDIKSNVSRTYINSLLDSTNYDYEITTDSLFDVVDTCKGDIILIIKTIGISSYAYYRNTINDILKAIPKPKD